MCLVNCKPILQTVNHNNMGFFDKFKQGLQKTTQLLNTDIRDLFKAQGRLVDESFLESSSKRSSRPTWAWMPPRNRAMKSARNYSRSGGRNGRHPRTHQAKTEIAAGPAGRADPFRRRRTDGHHGRRSERLRKDHLHRQARAHVPCRRQEGDSGGRRHLSRRRRRAVDRLGRPLGLRDRHRRAGQRSGQRGPSRRRQGHRIRRRRLHRRYGRTFANPART